MRLRSRRPPQFSMYFEAQRFPLHSHILLYVLGHRQYIRDRVSYACVRKYNCRITVSVQ